MFYFLWLPADRLDDLNWFEIFPTKGEAIRRAKQLAEKQHDFDYVQGWEVIYLSIDKREKTGGNYLDYQGKSTLVVEQRDYYYHGA